MKMTVFKWELENIYMSPLSPGECIQSPTFHVEETKTFEFCLKLFPSGCEKCSNSRKMELQLYRCDSNSENIEVEYKLSWESTNFSQELISASKTYKHKFQKQELIISGKHCFIEKFKCGKILNISCEILWHDDTFKDTDTEDLEDLSRDFTSLLGKETFSDITLRVGTRSFNVHRSILEVRFPALAKILQSTEKLGELVSRKDLKDLFLFLYSGTIQTSKKYRRLCMLLNRIGSPLLESMPNFYISSLFAKTLIEVKQISFEWTIENFKNVKANEEFSYIVAVGSSGSWMKLTALFKQNRTDYPEFIIERLDNSTNLCINCDISIKNAHTGFKEIILIHGYVIKRGLSVCRKISSLHRISDLQKPDYLRNGALNLSVHFELSTGEHKSHIIDTHFSNISSNMTHLRYLRRDFQKLLDNPVHSDIVLKVGERKFPAHKAILSARSSVFHKMFELDTAKKQNELVIENIRSEIVPSLLSYIYCGYLKDFDSDLAIDLYYAANKFQIHKLRLKCSTFLQSALIVGNVGRILILANSHNDEKLKKCVFNFIYNNAKEVMQSIEWIDALKCRPELPSKVLDAILKFVAQNTNKNFGNCT